MRSRKAGLIPASFSWQRRAARTQCSAWSVCWQRGVPEGDDGVPFILVDGPPLLVDDIGHRRQVVVEQGGQRLRFQPFGDARESLKVRKEDGEQTPLAAEFQALRMPDELFDDRGAQVLFEGVLDEEFLPSFGRVVDHAGTEERDGDTDLLDDQRKPESRPVGGRGQEGGQEEEETIHEQALDDAGDARGPDPGKNGQKEGQGQEKRVRRRPDEVVGKEVVQRRRINFNTRIDPGNGCRTQIEQTRRGETEKDVTVPEEILSRDEGLPAFPDTELALDDGRCAVSLVRSGFPPEVQKRVPPVVDRNAMASHAEGAADDLQRRIRSGRQDSAQCRRWQDPAVKDAE